MSGVHGVTLVAQWRRRMPGGHGHGGVRVARRDQGVDATVAAAAAAAAAVALRRRRHPCDASAWLCACSVCLGAPPRDAGVLAAAWRTASGMLAREPPPREPLTYLNALSAGAILTEPTDSERQRDITTSWSRRLAASWETARLSAILWWLDAGFALATWMGWFIPHDGTQHQHKEPG